MSNISEQYRKPLASDETGKAIADKLDGKTVEVETRNISEQYRQPLMTEETAREILEKIDGGGSGASALSELSDVTLTSPSDGQVLHYDGTEWINATPVAELPAVTSDDNGDVLTVVEGEWNKAEIPTPEPELPAVTADDNGKVLSVVEGVWDKADIQEESVIFDGTIGQGDVLTLSNNKKVLDITNIISKGKIPVIRGANGIIYTLSKTSDNIFTSVYPQGSGMRIDSYAPQTNYSSETKFNRTIKDIS